MCHEVSGEMILLGSNMKTKYKELTPSTRLILQTCSSPCRLPLAKFCIVANTQKHKNMDRSTLTLLLKQNLSTRTKKVYRQQITARRERERERRYYRFSMHVKQRHILRSCFHSLLPENIVFCFCTSQLFLKAGHGNNYNHLM